VCTIAAVVAPAALLHGAELTGQIEMLGGDKKVVPAPGAVVWVTGVSSLPAANPSPSMASRNKRFEPHVLAVTKGATITFPNVDKIHHNVFSRTPGSEFDLGLYRGGNSRDFRFSTPGLVRVDCNIHG
jgi:plastocyanin